MWFSQRLVLEKGKSHTRRPGNLRSQADRRPFGRRCRLERLEERAVLSGGVVTTSVSIGADSVRAGLVVGNEFVGAGSSNGDSLLVRYTSDGTFEGATVTPMATNNSDYWRALAKTTDGKLVAGGICGVGADSNQIDFTLARYNANGTLDTTFGSKGKVKTSFGTTDLLNALVVLQDEYTLEDGSKVPAGTIYAGGHNGTIGQTHTTLLARYTPSGKLDTSFGSGGLATHKEPAGEAWGLTFWDKDPDPDENKVEPRILQTGYTTSNDFVLVCYKLDGNLDTAFDGDGVLLSNLATFSHEAQRGNAVAIDALGRILVGGCGQQGTTYGSDFVIARYNANGRLDTNFGSNGYVLTDFGAGENEDARSIAIDPTTGNIAVVGCSDYDNPQFAVALYNPSGELLGKTTTTIGSRSEAYQIAYLGDGRIIVAGKAALPTGSGDRNVVALACYNYSAGTLALDPNFGPGISIDNVTVDEHVGSAEFTVTSRDSSVSRISYSTIEGTATSGDYTPVAAGTADFTGGVATFTVPITDDTMAEGNEVFYVRISNPVDGAGNPLTVPISNPVSVCTILDDNPPPPPVIPTLTVSDVSQLELDSGTTSFVFNVELSEASTNTITVAYATANGSATTANRDYRAKTGTLSFAPNVTRQTITVLVNGDTRVESDETFFVNLSNPTNATIADSQGAGTILNDDGLKSPSSLTASSSPASDAAVSDRAIYELLAADQFARRSNDRLARPEKEAALVDLVLIDLTM